MPRFIPDESTVIPRPTDARPQEIQPEFKDPNAPEPAKTTNYMDAMEAGLVEGNFTIQALAPVVESTAHNITGTGPEPIMSKWLRKLDTPVSTIDPNFKPDFESLKGTPYEQYADRFVGTNNQDEFNTVKSEIDQYMAYDKAFKDNPAVAWGTMIPSMLLDPVNLIPLAASAKGATLGRKILVGAASWGSMNAATLQAERDKNPLITDGDVVFSGAVGAMLGGVSGGILGKAEAAKLQREIAARVLGDRELLNKIKFTKTVDGWKPEVTNSAGAAEVSAVQAAHLDAFVAKVLNVGTLTKRLRGATLNAALSPLDTVRDLGNTVYGHVLRLDNTPDNFVTLYSKVLREKGEIAGFEKDLRDIKMDYFKRSDPATRLNSEAFNREAYLTYVRKDINPEYKSSISQINDYVEKVAQKTRGRYDDLVKARLFTDSLTDPKTKYYISRIWDRKIADKITYDEARQLANDQFARTPERFKDADAAFEELSSMLNKVRTGEDIGDLKSLSDKLEAHPDTQLKSSSYVKDNGTGGIGSFTKEKNKGFDDDLLAKYGLVNTDLSAIVGNYLLRTRKFIEMRRLLDRHNVETTTDLINKMKNERENMLRSARESKKFSTEQLAGLRKNLDYDIEQGTALIKEHFGSIHKKTALTPYIQTLKNYTSGVLLANVSASQLIQDPFNAVIREGLSTTLKEPTEALIKGVATLKMARADGEAMGFSLDLAMNDTLELLASGGDVSQMIGSTRLDRINAKTSHAFSLFSGVSPITAFEKNFVSLGIGSDMARTLRDWSKGTAKEAKIQRLQDLGIGEQHIKPILAQIKKYSKTDGNFTFLNLKEWDEGLAKDKMADAMQREVGTAIITPNMGDIPTMFLSTDWGTLIGQFRSFNSAAQSRMFAANIQDKNVLKTLSALFWLIGAGYARYSISEVLQGRVPDTDTETFLLQGLSRSGFLPLAYDTLLGVSPLQSGTKYSDSTFESSTLGPSARIIHKLYDLGLAAADPYEDKYSMASRATEIIPVLNFMYLGTNLRKMFKEKSKTDPAARMKRRKARAESKLKKQKRQQREF